LIYLAISLFFLVVSATFGLHHLLGEGAFWDARVYVHAIEAWRIGGNPYILSAAPNALPFVNPPLFLRIIVFVSKIFPGHLGWVVYCTAAVGSTLILPWIVTTICCPNQWMTAPVAFAIFSFQPTFLSEKTMLSGNLSTPIYVLALFAATLGLRRKQWWPFYLVVFFAAIAKPTFIALLLLPLLTEDGHLFPAIALTAASIGTYVLQCLTMPILYAGFQAGVCHQLVEKHDLGIGLYPLIGDLAHRSNARSGYLLTTLGFSLIMGAFVIAFGVLRHRRIRPLASSIWIAALLVLAILLNPRLQPYDEGVAVIPAFYICGEFLRRVPPTSANLGWIAVVASAVLTIYTKGTLLGVLLILISSLVLTVITLLSELGENNPEAVMTPPAPAV
jgi:hypothetical protein